MFTSLQVVTTDPNSGLTTQEIIQNRNIVRFLNPAYAARMYYLYTHVYDCECDVLTSIQSGEEYDSDKSEFSSFNYLDEGIVDDAVNQQVAYSAEELRILERLAQDEEYKYRLSEKEADLHKRLKNLQLTSVPKLQLPRSLKKLINSDFVRILEATFILYQQVTTPSSKKHPSMKYEFMQWIIAITGRSLTSLTVDYWMLITNTCRKIFKDMGIQGGEEEESDETIFDRIRGYLTNAKLAFDHPILVKIRNVFHYILALCLLKRFNIDYDTFMFSKAQKEASLKEHSSIGGFVMSVIEGALYIVERVYDVCRTGSWNALLHNGEDYQRWAEDVYRIKEDSFKLHNPEASGFSYHDFMSRMENCLDQGDAIMRYSVDLPYSAKTLIKKLMSELRILKANEFTKKAARENREPPFSLLLNGGSSVGKSSLLDIIYYAFAKFHDLPVGEDHIYTRTFSDEYWSGFTASVWMIILDDIANRNPEMKDDMSMTEILQIMNRTAFVPPQADLADKGRIPLRPKCVIATTNVKHLNASAYYCNPLAIARRFPLVVTAYPREEYCVRDNGTIPKRECRMLDSSRVPLPVEGTLPDLWEFKLEKVVPTTDGNKQGVRYKVMHGESYVDIYTLIQVIGRLSKKHFEDQIQVTESNDLCKTLEFCKECFLPLPRCSCETGDDLLEPPHEIGEHLNPFMDDDDVCRDGDCVKLDCSCISHIQGKSSSSSSWGSAYLLFLSTACAYGVYKVKKKAIRKAMVDIGADYVVDVAKDAITRPLKFLHSKVEEANDEVHIKLCEIRQQCIRSKITAEEALSFEKERVVLYMRELGDRMRTNVLYAHPILCGCIASVPIVLACWGIYSRFFQSKTQGNSSGQFDVKDEGDNPWFRNDYQVSEFDTGRLTKSWKGLTEEKIVELVGKNTLFAKHRYMSHGKKMAVDMRIVALGGHMYMTNAHNVPVANHDHFDLTIAQSPIGENLSGLIYYRVYSRDMFVMEEHDLVFFRMRSLPPRSSITELFPELSFQTVARGFILNRDENGMLQKNVCTNIRPDVDYISSTTSDQSNIWSMKVERNTVNGECGSVCLGFSPTGPFIGGIHVKGGAMRNAYSMRVTRSQIKQAFEHFQEVVIQNQRPNLTDEMGSEIPLLPLHHKSTFRYISEGNATVYGSMPVFRAAHKSQVGDTYIRSAVEKRGCVVKTTAPQMKGWVPWRHAALDTVNQTFNVKESVVNECVRSFANDIISGLSPKDLGELIVLNDRVTVNGQPGVKYIDKMKRNTSMGFPWNKKKSNYLTAPYQYEEWQDCVDFPESFYERTREIEKSYREGFRAMPIFKSHLKDEAVKIQKAIDGKTRVFSGAPADFAFVMRKHLLSFVRVLQNNRTLFEAAPGINTTSTEWHDLHAYLTQHGEDQMVAGDFSKYDKRMAALWILAAFEVISTVLRHAGRSDEDIAIVNGISRDIAFPLCDFNGDLVQFWGSNPSGHPLTVVINCIVNSLYMRYSWIENGYDLADFKKKVALITYGDDNTMGISRDAPLFNHTSIQARLSEIGVVYTMADKDSASVPYIHIDDISFLKRGWRFEPEVNSYVAPLEEDSIFKMLTKGIPSSEVCPEMHGVNLLHNALKEYWYYGREIFNEKRKMFQEVIEECALQDYADIPFATFDEIRNEYINNSPVELLQPESN